MSPRGRRGSPAVRTPRSHLLAAGVPIALVLSSALGACSAVLSPPSSGPPVSTTSTTAAATSAAAAAPVVAVPDVIGMKIEAATFFMYMAGFFTVPLTTPCDKGTLTSQSVVASLSILREPPDLNVGGVPLVAGTSLPVGSWVGITWSGCYPNGSVVPEIAGLTFAAAVSLLHTAGLTWACYSMATLSASLAGVTTTTTGGTKAPTTPSSPTSASTTTTLPHKTSTTTTTLPPTVLAQDTKAGTVLNSGTSVAFVMHHCPQ